MLKNMLFIVSLLCGLQGVMACENGDYVNIEIGDTKCLKIFVSPFLYGSHRLSPFYMSVPLNKENEIDEKEVVGHISNNLNEQGFNLLEYDILYIPGGEENFFDVLVEKKD